ncbi:tyrosine-type recombinase/integrase [Embleya sp. MST-111070]|uniref:tyrosine-type recombinase/integrase n=1 Tax=Embleya sp. MST-111070 TaxID=3398231 RepID=UPI003F73B5CC
MTRRRDNVDLDAGTIRIDVSAIEMSNGQRLTGPPKSAVGKRTVTIPTPILLDLRRHVEWFAEKEPDGLFFACPKGAALRRCNFSRVWRRGTRHLGVSDLHFHDLRHTGNVLAAETGATLRDLIDRMGQSTSKAALIYQHARARGVVSPETTKAQVSDHVRDLGLHPTSGRRESNSRSKLGKRRSSGTRGTPRPAARPGRPLRLDSPSVPLNDRESPPVLARIWHGERHRSPGWSASPDDTDNSECLAWKASSRSCSRPRQVPTWHNALEHPLSTRQTP